MEGMTKMPRQDLRRIPFHVFYDGALRLEFGNLRKQTLQNASSLAASACFAILSCQKDSDKKSQENMISEEV